MLHLSSLKKVTWFLSTLFPDADASVSSREAPVGVAKLSFPSHVFLVQKSLFPNLQKEKTGALPFGPTGLICELLSCSESPLSGIRTRPTSEAKLDPDPICRGKNPTADCSPDVGVLFGRADLKDIKIILTYFKVFNAIFCLPITTF